MIQDKIRASWIFNQTLQEEVNGGLRRTQKAGAGQRAFALPESEGSDTGRPGSRGLLPVSWGLLPVSSSLSLKRSENHSQSRHLRQRYVYFSPGSNTNPESLRLALDTFQRCGSAEPRVSAGEASFPLPRRPALGRGALRPPPRGRLPVSAPASGRHHGRPIRMLKRGSSDALAMPRPCARPLQPRARRRPPRRR